MAVAVRKVVTVLFCDVVEFTTMGEELDPERLRGVMTRFFDEMQAVLERHGATVEKFIGDEVMAVFGVPVVHEDDALRAVRAAAEMMQRLDALNDELERSAGARIQIRIGVNTGEVVAGDHSAGHGFVTGDAVNLAKRLETAAEPGQILIGKATYPLVSHAIEAGPLQTFKVKGKADPVSSLRVQSVDQAAEAMPRRLDAPLVGRREELGSLLAAFGRVERDRVCELVTILGVPGIGKSRLAAEVAAEVRERAHLVKGRCLAYGDGITYWPLVEIVRQLGGVAALESVLGDEEDAPLIAERVRAAVGATQASGTTEETFWAVRRLFESVASRRPLLVCIEDIHWAEPTLLDFIEYLLGWSHDAPILVLCLARPDLLELRPTWLTPRPNALTLQLEPLSHADADALFEILRGDVELPAGARERIGTVAEGNPLFVEQMVAMAADAPASAVSPAVPPTMQALLAERLDRLDRGERAVVERAAVVGREFSRGAVVELAPPELRAGVSRELLSLVRKDLVAPDRTALAHDDGFRFRHVLIRDAAYEGLAKETRGELHEQYADWLERTAGSGLGEVEEIIGYHLEQAHSARAALGHLDDRVRRLAARAATRLGAAGERAFRRGDMRAAAGLLTRAIVLSRDDDQAQVALAPVLGHALIEIGDLARAEGVLTSAIETASASGNVRDATRAAVIRAFGLLRVDPAATSGALEQVATDALVRLREIADDLGAAQAARLLSHVHARRNDWAETATVLEVALAHAERSGDSRERGSILNALAASLYLGPTPVPEAIDRCRELISRGRGDRPLEASTDGILAALEAMRGRFGEARALAARARAALEELGVPVWLAKTGYYTSSVELLAGDAAAAEAELRTALRLLEDAGDRNDAARVAALLAEALCEQGRIHEAEELVAATEGFTEDLITHVVSERVRARLGAARGDSAALAIARRASKTARGTDALNVLADALLVEAEVTRMLDPGADWRGIAREAVRLYERKGNVVSANRARTALDGRLDLVRPER